MLTVLSSIPRSMNSYAITDISQCRNLCCEIDTFEISAFTQDVGRAEPCDLGQALEKQASLSSQASSLDHVISRIFTWSSECIIDMEVSSEPMSPPVALQLSKKEYSELVLDFRRVTGQHDVLTDEDVKEQLYATCGGLVRFCHTLG